MDDAIRTLCIMTWSFADDWPYCGILNTILTGSLNVQWLIHDQYTFLEFDAVILICEVCAPWSRPPPPPSSTRPISAQNSSITTFFQFKQSSGSFDCEFYMRHVLTCKRCNVAGIVYKCCNGGNVWRISHLAFWGNQDMCPVSKAELVF